MKLLYDIINKNAQMTFEDDGHVISSETYRRWAQTWILEAKKLKADFKAQGLMDTAKEIERIIDEQSKYMREIEPRPAATSKTQEKADGYSETMPILRNA